MGKIKNLNELTGIRFFAALHVVLYHNLYLMGDTKAYLPQAIRTIISYGDSAVALFFILSGFILTYVYSSREITYKKNFYISRLSRLYPIYILGLILDLPRGIGFFTSSHQLQEAFLKIGVSLGAYLSMLQSWYPRVTASWNSPAWSLSVEAFFYILFPFVLPLILKIKKQVFLGIFAYLFPVLIYTSLKEFTIVDLHSSFFNTFWRSFPLLRLGEFIIGMILGKYYLENHKTKDWFFKKKALASFLFWGLTFLSFVLITLDLGIERHIKSTVLLTPIFSFLILALAHGNIYYTKWLGGRILVLLGGASYSLYILHQPLLNYIHMLTHEKSLPIFFIYLVLAILFSIFTFKKIEVPLQNSIRKRFLF